jgi:hypothetical protein
MFDVKKYKSGLKSVEIFLTGQYIVTNEEHYLGATRRFHSFIWHLIDYSEVVKT